MSAATSAPVAVVSVIVLDLRSRRRDQYAVPASVARSGIRGRLDGLTPGSVIQLRVNRWSLPSDVVGLVPEGVRVQLSADDRFTEAQWARALRGASWVG